MEKTTLSSQSQNATGNRGDIIWCLINQIILTVKSQVPFPCMNPLGPFCPHTVLTPCSVGYCKGAEIRREVQ